MCGIAGVFYTQNQNPQPLLNKLAQALSHRGPDGEGFFVAQTGYVGLVHKRLSIIDVAGGAQPFEHKEHALALVANGEIYNYKNLQQWCHRQGFSLASQSDCEPPLHLYHRYGVDFVKYLQGMYALALWDARNETLVLARDPMGIKPLYYAETDDGVAFASEPAALTRSGWILPQVAEQKVFGFLCRQYVAGRQTLFQHVQRVLPGEVLEIKHGKIHNRHLFLPDMAAAKPISEVSEEQALTAFGNVFGAAVSTHLQSDVPYGAFLSGGIDSTTLVHAMSQQTPQPVRTYTVGFDSATVADERTTATAVSSHLHTAHTDVFFTEDDFWHYLLVAAEALDDLVADYAALPLLKLAQHASKDVKVVLSGEGGDEVFAGYSRYGRGKWWHKWALKKFRGKGDAAYFPELWQKRICAHKPKLPPLPYTTDGWTSLQNMQALDMQDWLADDLLVKVDRCLMKYGVEGRVPFLDTAVVVWGFSLPDKLKRQHNQGKWLLKKHLESVLPWFDVWVKKKGFSVPIAHWLENKHGQVATFLIENEGIAAISHKKALQKFVSLPFTGRRAKLAFSLLCYGLWYNTHILQQPNKQQIGGV